MALLNESRTSGDSGHLADHNQIHQKLNAVHDVVADYGAKGDGATDDTAALAAALSAGAGASIVLPAGTYLCSQELLVDTAWTAVRGLGKAVIQFTGATNGVHVTAQRCEIADVVLRAGNSGCVTALLADGTPSYLHLSNVNVDRLQNTSWDTGWDLVNCQNLVAVGGEINAHDAGSGGTIDNLIINRDTSRGNTFSGVSLKGRNSVGEYTSRGVYVTNGGSLAWFGGVVQGGFSVAAVDVDGIASVPYVAVAHTHVEVTGGGGVGYRYNNSAGAMTLLAPKGGSVSVGPTANAWDFAIVGGAIDSVTLGAFAKAPTIAPVQLNGSLTDNGASDPRFGPFRVVGNGTPQPQLVRVIEGYEIGDPAAPASNRGLLYFRDSGAGKTQLVARFATGAVQVIATEP